MIIKNQEHISYKCKKDLFKHIVFLREIIKLQKNICNFSILNRWSFSLIRNGLKFQILTFHKTTLFLSVLFTARPRRSWRRRSTAHPRRSHHFDHLEAEGRDVVLDLVDVVFGDTLVFCFTLLFCHISSHKISHDVLR